MILNVTSHLEWLYDNSSPPYIISPARVPSPYTAIYFSNEVVSPDLTPAKPSNIFTSLQFSFLVNGVWSLY